MRIVTASLITGNMSIVTMGPYESSTNSFVRQLLLVVTRAIWSIFRTQVLNKKNYALTIFLYFPKKYFLIFGDGWRLNVNSYTL